MSGGLYIHHLSADHTIDSCLSGQNLQCLCRAAQICTLIERLCCGLKGIVQKCISCQHTHGMSEFCMGGQLTTAVLIIVHSGQVIMRQRIGVDHLHSCHERLHFPSFSSEHPIGFLHQQRAQTLATCCHTVIHGFHDLMLRTALLRQITLHDLLNSCRLTF